jgi:hypothetical protein
MDYFAGDVGGSFEKEEQCLANLLKIRPTTSWDIV